MINVYSKSESELGRLLSNFARTPFRYKGRVFQSVKGWWYWYMTGEESLCSLWGYAAKREGRKYECDQDTPCRELLKQIYELKLLYNENIKVQLLKSTEAFTHYYVGKEGERIPTRWLWTAKLWEEIRKEMNDMQEDLFIKNRELTSGWPQAHEIVMQNMETGEVTVIPTGITKEQIGQDE